MQMQTRARFTVTSTAGTGTAVAVEGLFDAGAARGFDALVEWLERLPDVIVDLDPSTVLTPLGQEGLGRALDRLREHGSRVIVRCAGGEVSRVAPVPVA